MCSHHSLWGEKTYTYFAILSIHLQIICSAFTTSLSKVTRVQQQPRERIFWSWVFFLVSARVHFPTSILGFLCFPGSLVKREAKERETGLWLRNLSKKTGSTKPIMQILSETNLQICSSLQCNFNPTFFDLMVTLYEQVDDVVMGSPLGFMWCIEEKPEENKLHSFWPHWSTLTWYIQGEYCIADVLVRCVPSNKIDVILGNDNYCL